MGGRGGQNFEPRPLNTETTAKDFHNSNCVDNKKTINRLTEIFEQRGKIHIRQATIVQGLPWHRHLDTLEGRCKNVPCSLARKGNKVKAVLMFLPENISWYF